MSRSTTVSTGLAADIAGDWRFLMLVGTGLLMQVSHPVIGGGVGRYSSYQTDPFGRFDRSVWPVLAMVIKQPDAGAFSADLRAMHRRIGGVDHAGRSFHAWDPEGAFLVPATACYASVKAAELFGSPLTAAQREEVYAAWRQAGLDFGIPGRNVPEDYAAYEAWLADMVEHRLEDHPTARDLLATLRRPPAPPYVPGLVWGLGGRQLVGSLATLVTVGTLPASLRETLGLGWTTRQERRLRAFGRLVRLVDRVLPAPVRQLSRRMVDRRWEEFQAYAAEGARLGIAPALVASGEAGADADPASGVSA